MKEIVGNMWDHHRANKWVCVTTNGHITKYGLLVMGAGCAGECAERYPDIPKTLGSLVSTLGNHCFVVHPGIISFPTIDDLSYGSTVPIVLRSAIELKKLLDVYRNITEIIIPRPGCGLGGLNWESQVKPILQEVFTDDRFVIISN